MISIKNLTKSYGEKKIFTDLSFDLSCGVCTVFTGVSGIGKTTLLRIIAGLEAPDGGSVNGLDNMKKTFVFQDNVLLEDASVIQNILCVTKNIERAEYFLKRTGLFDEKQNKASDLSGGMERRLAIARALAFGGDFYYLDEPLRELDSDTEKTIAALIKEEIAGKTAVLISHSDLQTQYLAQCVIHFEGSPMHIS